MKYRVEFSGEYEIDSPEEWTPGETRAVSAYIKTRHEALIGADRKTVRVKVTPVVRTYRVTYRDEVLLHTVVEADNLQAAADKFREQYLN